MSLRARARASERTWQRPTKMRPMDCKSNFSSQLNTTTKRPNAAPRACTILRARFHSNHSYSHPTCLHTLRLSGSGGAERVSSHSRVERLFKRVSQHPKRHHPSSDWAHVTAPASSSGSNGPSAASAPGARQRRGTRTRTRIGRRTPEPVARITRAAHTRNDHEI